MRFFVHRKTNWQAEAGGVLALLGLFLAILVITVTESSTGPYPRSGYPWLFVTPLLFAGLHFWGRFK